MTNGSDTVGKSTDIWPPNKHQWRAGKDDAFWQGRYYKDGVCIHCGLSWYNYVYNMFYGYEVSCFPATQQTFDVVVILDESSVEPSQIVKRIPDPEKYWEEQQLLRGII